MKPRVILVIMSSLLKPMAIVVLIITGLMACSQAPPTAISAPPPTETPTPTQIPTDTPLSTPLPTSTPAPPPVPSLSDVVRRVKPSIVLITTEEDEGTGFIFEDGWILTNSHVVGLSDNVNIQLGAGLIPGVVVGRHTDIDIAVIKFQASEEVPASTFAVVGSLDLGDEVAVIGFPLGSELGQTPSVTERVVSSLRRVSGIGLIHTNLPFDPGNSGGPLLNERGEVVGIITAKVWHLDSSGQTERIGTAISIEDVKPWLLTLKSGVSYGQPIRQAETPMPGQNQPPTITNFLARPPSGIAPLKVTFTLRASDPDGTIASVEWDYDGDGSVDEVTSTLTTTYTFNLSVPQDISIGPDILMYDIGADVPSDQVEIIKTGFEIGQAFLDSDLGGGISEGVRRSTTVKIIATGRGNEEPGGGGSCCTGLGEVSSTFKATARVIDDHGATSLTSTNVSMRESTIRPFFDVAHPHWAENRPLHLWTLTADHQKTVIHEYTHGWQHHLGCITIFHQPLGFWLNEGIAEYIAYEAMIKRGHMAREDVMNNHLIAARSDDQLTRPLRDFGGTTAETWPGHVGYIALDRLVQSASDGILSLRIVCEEVAAGASVPEAFKTAFGVTLDDFYDQFESVRQQLISN